jgi:hypothetical protein
VELAVFLSGKCGRAIDLATYTWLVPTILGISRNFIITHRAPSAVAALNLPPDGINPGHANS